MDNRQQLGAQLRKAPLHVAMTVVAITVSRVWSLFERWGGHTLQTSQDCARAANYIRGVGRDSTAALEKGSLFIPQKLGNHVNALEKEDFAHPWFLTMTLAVIYFDKVILLRAQEKGVKDIPNDWFRKNQDWLVKNKTDAAQVVGKAVECLGSKDSIVVRTIQELSRLEVSDQACALAFEGQDLWPGGLWGTVQPIATQLGFCREAGLNEHSATIERQAARLGETLDSIKQSVTDTGPIYNALNEYCYVIPGKTQTHKGVRKGLRTVALAKTRFNRLVDFRGVTATSDAEALVMPEDIDACLLLAYGQEKPEIPHFSLEPVGGDKGRVKGWRFDEKIFSPSWIAHVDLGRTFFFTDYLMKQIVLGNAYVSMMDPTYFRPCNGKSSHGLPDWLEELPTFDMDQIEEDPLLKDGQGGRLCWKLESIQIARRGRRFLVGEGKVYVEGSSAIRLSDGTWDRSYRLNDCRTIPGAKAKALTDNIPRLAQAFPSIARLQELFKLIYLCNKLRDSGVKLSSRFQRRVENLRENLPRQNVKAYVPKPYHRYGCTCDGGTDPRGARIEDMPSPDLPPAAYGRLYHAFELNLIKQTPNHGFRKGSGWEPLGLNRRMGGTKIPDYVWVNHETKELIIEDTYTGKKFDVGQESLAHYLKGWKYLHEPEIQELLVGEGYQYLGYVCGNPTGTLH